MTTKHNLKESFKEFIERAIDEEKKSRFKLAVTAYFKAITQICDLIILRKRGYTPQSHSEIFRLLEKEFAVIYTSVDSIFKTYQDTYSIPLRKESCKIIKNEIKNIIRNGELSEEFKETLSKL
ncbi:hypothetical protein HY498_03580 [Candidatus Woesearchaeota archaeon]|nr:hypothetical protein [Candidatus Woesearchaeota archaeon]